MTNLENDDPALLILNESDHYNGWEYESNDSGPAYGPFLETCRTPIEGPNGNPEVFSMSCLTNAYGLLLHKPQTFMHEPKLIHQLEIGVLIQLIQITKKHCHLNTWTDITSSDVKVFLAHNIIVGLLKKSNLEKY